MIHRFHKLRFLIPLFILAIAALLTLAVYTLWNNVLTDILPVKAITYWQALGLLILCKILFSGFPGRRGHFGPPPFARRRMMMRHWQSLAPDQREKLREKMQSHFGSTPWCDATQSQPAASTTPAASAPTTPPSQT